jgi:inner membrane protein
LLYRDWRKDTFVPFMYDWSGLYQQGVIDGKEWRDNRWKIF